MSNTTTTLLTIALLIGAFLIYFLPATAAVNRKHRNAGAIFVLNLLLGWTLLGWVVALVWALSKPATVVVQPVPAAPLSPILEPIVPARSSVADEIQKLLALRESGALTADEFELQKRRLLA